MKIIPYGRQEITEEDIQSVVKVLKSDFLTQGPAINEFENSFAEYIGAKYAVAVANGTAALHLSVLSLGLGPKDKVITTPITFSASANCVLYAGGEILFSDIDPDSFLIDLDKIQTTIEAQPPGTIKGIIPVDFAGYPVNMEKLRKIADRYGLWILQDACHAPGGSFYDSYNKLQKCGNGNYADTAIFSFHPVKHIAAGEGGMITTNSKEIYEKVKLLRTHGITKSPDEMGQNHGGWYYEMVDLGFNYRLTDIQASLGLSQLKRAETGIKHRQEIANRYRKELKNLPLKLPIVSENVQHAYHLFIIQVEKRKELYDYLKEYGIYCQVHYIPVHLSPFYKSLGWAKGDLPIAEAYYNKCLSLPMYPSLTEEEQSFVIEKIKKFFE